MTTLEKILKIPPSAFEREVTFYTFKLRPFLLFNSSQSNIKLHNKLYQGKFFPCSCRERRLLHLNLLTCWICLLTKGLVLSGAEMQAGVLLSQNSQNCEANIWNMPGMFIMLWAVSMKIRTCEQGTKPQTTVVACSWLGFLMPAVLFP